MKVLFAVHDEKVSLSIVKKYQREYKEIISYKNVYYFNAILKELQRDKTYDRIIIDEELEEFTSTSYEEKDKFIFNKLDSITDEASNSKGNDIPIILICSDRRTKSEDILVKLFGIGIYNAIIGNDRSTDEVCRLLNNPRSKKDAKTYYKIDSKAVDYDPEHEDDVSEEEMQHILSYFKKLGKKEDKYVEAFNKILSQYNENQMKIIIAILPTNVKAVLEESSPEYQRIAITSGSRRVSRPISNQPKVKPTSETLLNGNSDSKNGRPIVVPSSMDKNVIKKITIKKPSALQNIDFDDEDEYEDVDEDIDVNVDDFEDVKEIEEIQEVEEVKPTPKRRGRPPKKAVEEVAEEPVKKKRGRPSVKNIVQEEKEPEEDVFENILPGFEEEKEKNEPEKIEDFEEIKPINENLLGPEFEDFEEDEDDEFAGDELDENIDNEEIEDLEDNSLNNDLDRILPGFEDEEETEKEEPKQEFYEVSDEDPLVSRISQSKEIESFEKNYYDDYDYTNYNNLLSSDRKVIAFVGTSKNGTSFIVNNVAKVLSENGIDTAILDATKNKNSYYIYNNNDDSLRNIAANSIKGLINGNAEGMPVSRNLTVYVGVPGQDDSNMQNVGPILENLVKTHSAVLIDCDFNTPIEYFANAQEIYLVQSMDVLTIQPLTAFLKELKNKDVLQQNKLRVIINKVMRLKGITSKQIVGGMSNYNNPEMSIMTELFDRNQMVPIEIPFDIDVYQRYLEGLAECNINTNKYPREFQDILKKLVSIIYPLLPAKKMKERAKKGYQYSNGFSNSVNNTLNNMKRNY